MKAYQERYIANLKQILERRDIFHMPGEDFNNWYAECRQAEEKINTLKKENMDILTGDLFPVLDDLYNASDEDLKDLESFSDQLMDWKNNLDCGVYVIIHEAMLRMYRVAKNPSRIIKELYKLGMGIYYQDLAYRGSDHPLARQLHFENEMLFTEAASYFRYFSSISDDETRGYIIRSLANISISANDRKKRLSSSIKTLNIVTDPYYISLSPNLPWKNFERRTYQQISSVRSTLSRGDFSNEELALIMEACQVIFEPEKGSDKPNVRWLWPYYEMEYNLGLADLKTTLARMEDLIEAASYDQYDESGLYANVQLPVYYGRLLRDNPQLLQKDRYTSFLKDAYDKMMKTILSMPSEYMGEYFLYIFYLLADSYFETEGVEPYFDVMKKLIVRFSPKRYIRALLLSDILELYCNAILSNDEHFFDELPFLKEINAGNHKEALLQYVKDCALFFDFGLIPMNMDRILDTRSLFEREAEIFTLHTDIGYQNLRRRASTERFADVALGHHRCYDENGGYPEEYVRLDSDYRKMTDLFCIVTYLEEHYEEEKDQVFESIASKSHTSFSPVLVSYLEDKDFRNKIKELLVKDKGPYYRQLYDQLKN